MNKMDTFSRKIYDRLYTLKVQLQFSGKVSHTCHSLLTTPRKEVRFRSTSFSS